MSGWIVLHQTRYGLYLLIKMGSCGILVVCSISDEK